MTGDSAGALRTLAGGLAQVDTRQVSDHLINAAEGLAGFESRLRSGTRLERVFGLTRIDPTVVGTLDPWAAPDGAWQQILETRPHLACYPLGEFTERALKKALTELLAAVGLRAGSRHPPEAASVRGDLVRQLGPPRRHALLRRFLAHFFFELCIEFLRRDRPGARFEPAFLYHFTQGGRFHSLRWERSWRHWLTGRGAHWADRFLPHLLTALSAETTRGVRHSIRAGFRAIGVVSRPDLDQGSLDPTFRVAASDRFEEVADALDSEDRRSILLILGRRGGNVSVGCEWLRGAPGASVRGELHPLIGDLVEIGTALYVAGVHVPRQSHLGRCMNLEIHVRRPRRWNDVASLIENTASVLTRDRLAVQFVPKVGAPVASRAAIPSASTDRPICLFSGGLDSLAGAVQLLERGERPIFLSHYANSSLAALQKRLIAQLRDIWGQERFDHLGVYVAPATSTSNPLPLPPRQREPMARFLRPFMLLSLACSAALHVGSRRVLICESGPLAIYPLFNESQIRTRSVDPRFVAGFQGLVQRVFKTPLEIRNPLLYQTKGEALAPLAEGRLSSLVAGSNSCWHWAQLKAVAARQGLNAAGKTHDGKCLPCLIRRTAIHAAGLWDSDAGYLTDLFRDFADLDQESLLMTADWFRFCENMRTLPSRRALVLAPDFSICAPGVDCNRLLRMFRRNGRELRACLLERGSRELLATFDLTP